MFRYHATTTVIITIITQQLSCTDIPCMLCSAGDAVTSCAVGVAPDGVSGTVLVDAVLV